MKTEVKRNIEYLNQARTMCLKVIDGLSFEALCRIPEGFNNSILWNIGHLAVTQQLLCYKNSGLPMHIKDQEIIDGFRKGSKPKTEYTQEEWQTLLDFFKTLPSKLEEDFESSMFKNYDSYLTSFGVLLSNIEEAITFNNVHEGMHLGYIMALKRAISAS